MVCARCSNKIPDDSRFCAHCGAQSLENKTTLRTPPDASADNDLKNTPPTTPPGNRKADNIIGLTIDKRYRIDARLGTGGMGAVYRATRLLIGDEVAVKILRSEVSAEAQAHERFRREAQAAARLKHPNVVTIYDFGVTDDQMAYLVMELVEGETLRSLIRRSRALDPPAVTEIATQICAALDEANRLGIVHRDLKPDNIIIKKGARGLVVKVLDFGIAKLRDAPASEGPLTQTGVMIGTPHYMSPEQCLGQELDGRADIYSLGIMLYEMLSGTVPFDAANVTAIVLQQVNNPPPPLRPANHPLPPAVESVVMRALAKPREARQQTASALAQEMVAAVYGNAVTKPADRGGQAGWQAIKSSGDPAKLMPDTVPIHTPATPLNVPAPFGGRSKLVPIVIALSVAVLFVTVAVVYLLVSKKESSQTNDNRAALNRNGVVNGNVNVNRNDSRVANANVNNQPASLAKFVGRWGEKWGDINNVGNITIMEGTGGRPIVTMIGGWRIWDEKLIGENMLTFRLRGGGSDWEFLYRAFYQNDKTLRLMVHRVHDNKDFVGEMYR